MGVLGDEFLRAELKSCHRRRQAAAKLAVFKLYSHICEGLTVEGRHAEWSGQAKGL